MSTMALRRLSCVPRLLILSVLRIPPASPFRVAVFGGSGFIGRRVCQRLVGAGVEVVSVSRSGRPSYWVGPWAEKVRWVPADLLHNNVHTGGNITTDDSKVPIDDPLLDTLGKIDAAISLVGNVKPNPEWVSSSFFGLNFDDKRLYLENGATNERACSLSKAAGADRFVFVSVSYETAKALEGPIPGYLGGKRVAEHAAASAFGEHQTVVVGPSLVYGGKRLIAAGDSWRKIVESPPVRAYLSSQDFLRSLSSAPIQDWLEKLIFSPPVGVDSVAAVICAGALGLIGKGMVPPRRQGFYDTNGKPVQYDNVLFVDGTKEIERLATECDMVKEATTVKTASSAKGTSDASAAQVGIDQFGGDELFPGYKNSSETKEPPCEGALIGLKPYLYPIPVAAIFFALFTAIATGQFDTMNEQYYDTSASI